MAKREVRLLLELSTPRRRWHLLQVQASDVITARSQQAGGSQGSPASLFLPSAVVLVAKPAADAEARSLACDQGFPTLRGLSVFLLDALSLRARRLLRKLARPCVPIPSCPPSVQHNGQSPCYILSKLTLGQFVPHVLTTPTQHRVMLAMPAQPNSVFGDCINALLHHLASTGSRTRPEAAQRLAKALNYARDTIYRWAQGTRIPDFDMIERIVTFGAQAGMPEAWGKRLLSSIRHPAQSALIAEQWPTTISRPIPTNLPNKQHDILIGRTAELNRLLEFLRHPHQTNHISIDGIGGVGKTALALEAAYTCLANSSGIRSPSEPVFDAILFINCKREFFSPDVGRILPYVGDVNRTITHMINTLSSTLHQEPCFSETLAEQHAWFNKTLTGLGSVLLIIDDLETLEPDTLNPLIDILSLPPSGVKILTTSRERFLGVPIPMNELNESSAKELIKYLLSKYAVDPELTASPSFITNLYTATGGVPLAIRYAVGMLVAGYDPTYVVQRFDCPTSDLARFMFTRSIDPIRKTPAYNLLMALSIFRTRADKSALFHTAGYASDFPIADRYLPELTKRFLVSQRDRRYQFLPLTRKYAQSERNKHSTFKDRSRELYIEWYTNLVTQFGAPDWQATADYGRIEREWENLLSLFSWCEEKNRYETLKTFWRRNLGSHDGFAITRGHFQAYSSWLSRLINIALSHSDQSTAAEAEINRSYVDILRLHIVDDKSALDAEIVEARLIKLLDTYKGDDDYLAYMCAYMLGVFALRHRDAKQAMVWMTVAQEIVQKSTEMDATREEMEINMNYYMGCIKFRMGKFGRAEDYFAEVITSAGLLGWPRAINYSENYLADMEVVKGNIHRAKRYADSGIRIASQMGDVRRIGYWLITLGNISVKEERLNDARDLAQQALGKFTELGMRREMWNIDNWIKGDIVSDMGLIPS
jgi:hypothetical protein